MWDPDHYQETIRLYYQLIYGVDHAVGMIRAALEKEGVAGNTIIIFTSDNGYHMGAHGFGGKVLPYEEGSKVPLIIYDPRSPESQRGVRCESLTAGIDMAPTVLDYAGMAAPKEMDGGSLVPLVENPHRRVRDSLLLMNCWGSASTQTMAIVTERWKYLYWYFGDSMQPVEELFDLQADPGEVRNVAGELRNIDQLKLLRARYDEELARWSLETVPYNNYPVYGRLFDRSLTWDQKKDLVPKRYMDDYLFWVNFNKKKDQGQKKAADSEP